jgi:hypothetical protein
LVLWIFILMNGLTNVIQFGILPAWQLFETLTIVILLVYNCNFEARRESY